MWISNSVPFRSVLDIRKGVRAAKDEKMEEMELAGFPFKLNQRNCNAFAVQPSTTVTHVHFPPFAFGIKSVPKMPCRRHVQCRTVPVPHPHPPSPPPIVRRMSLTATSHIHHRVNQETTRTGTYPRIVDELGWRPRASSSTSCHQCPMRARAWGGSQARARPDLFKQAKVARSQETQSVVRAAISPKMQNAQLRIPHVSAFDWRPQNLEGDARNDEKNRLFGKVAVPAASEVAKTLDLSNPGIREPHMSHFHLALLWSVLLREC